jgi:small subunit ribosomal protein S17
MGHKRVLEGFVVKTGTMTKTIVVEVHKVMMHALYRKRIRTQRSYKVHDEENKAKVGDKVRIMETRHISKEKYFSLVEILESQKEE